MTASPRPECVAIRSVPTVRVNLCRSKIWPRHHRPHHVKVNRVKTEAAPRSRHHRPTRFRVATDGVTAGRITNDSFITDGVTTDRRTADRSTTDRLTASTSLATASLATASPRRRLADGYLDGVATDRDIPDRSNTESGPVDRVTTTASPQQRHHFHVNAPPPTAHQQHHHARVTPAAPRRPRHPDQAAADGVSTDRGPTEDVTSDHENSAYITISLFDTDRVASNGASVTATQSGGTTNGVTIDGVPTGRVSLDRFRPERDASGRVADLRHHDATATASACARDFVSVSPTVPPPTA